MNKNNVLKNNTSINFILKGFTSILIGCYILGGTILIKSTLTHFLIDESPLGNLSVEIIELLFLGITFLVFLFSSTALIYKGKRTAKKQHYKLWNTKTKKVTGYYLSSITLIFVILITLTNAGSINYITPILLTLYGLLLLLLKNKKRKHLLILSGICFVLTIICFLTPSCWNSAMSILGISHILYGLIVK